jgi:ankyrin repeat protein
MAKPSLMTGEIRWYFAGQRRELVREKLKEAKIELSPWRLEAKEIVIAAKRIPKILRSSFNTKGASLNSTSLLALLLDRGWDIESLDPNEQTPLHAAASGGSVEVITLLRDEGADQEQTRTSQMILANPIKRWLPNSSRKPNELMAPGKKLAKNLEASNWSPSSTSLRKSKRKLVSLLLQLSHRLSQGFSEAHESLATSQIMILGI